MPSKPPKNAPPLDLGETGRDVWAACLAEFDVETTLQHTLRLSCVQFDVAAEARRDVAKRGNLVPDRFGALKENPSVAIERNASIAAARLLRELSLDWEPPAEFRKPRRPGSR